MLVPSVYYFVEVLAIEMIEELVVEYFAQFRLVF